MLQSVCDNIPNEPEATDCTRIGGSIKVLHPQTNRMAVVMFSPFGEPLLGAETAQAFSTAVAGAIYECSPAGLPASFELTTAMSCLVSHLNDGARRPAPRALALLPLSGIAGLPNTGIASPDGHVLRYPMRLGQIIRFEVIVLGAAPAA